MEIKKSEKSKADKAPKSERVKIPAAENAKNGGAENPPAQKKNASGWKNPPKNHSGQRPSSDGKKSHPILTKVAVRIVTILLLCAIFVGGGYFTLKKFTKVESQSKSALVEKQLFYCQEFVTAKYRYSDIVSLKKSSGFAKSYSIVKYTGILRVGIADMTDISYSLSIDGKKVHLKVPPAEILGNDLVSQEVFDEKQSIFVPITTQEIFDEIEEARDLAAEDMVTEGILDEAREYAIRILTQFMLSAGFEEVTTD